MNCFRDLPRADRDRLSKIVGMLGSVHEGERAAAAMKTTDLLRAHGMTWAEVLATLPVEQPRRYLTLSETRLAAAKMAVTS